MPYSIKLPTGEVLGNIPDEVSQEDAFNLATNYMKDTATVGGEAKTGLSQGMNYLTRSFKDTLPEYWYKAVGDEENAARQAEQGEERKAKDASENFSPFQTTGDIRNVSDAVKFAARVGTQGAVSSVPAIGAAAATTALGGTPLIAGGAAYLSTLPLSLQDISDTFKEEGIKPENHVAAMASLVAFNNLLEFAPETGALLRAAKKDVQKGVLKSFLKGALRTGTEEAATSVGQDLASRGTVSQITDKPFLTEDTLKSSFENAVQGFIGGAFTGGPLEALPGHHTANESVVPPKPSDILKTEEVTPEVAEQPVDDLTKPAEKAQETVPPTPEEAFSNLFQNPIKKAPVKPKDTNETSVASQVEGIKEQPNTPAVKQTLDSVPFPNELNETKFKLPKEQGQLPVEVTRAMVDAEKQTKAQYLDTNKVEKVSMLPKAKKIELDAQVKQAREDVAKKYLNAQMNQSIENATPVVRARFDNAKNGQQKTYANLVNDFADIVGLNMPVAVLFKDGDNAKLNTVPFDAITKAKLDGLSSQVNEKTVGLGGIVDYGQQQSKPLAAIVLDTSTVKSPQDVLQVLAHEMGHVVDFAMMKNNPELAKQVNDAWLKDVTPIAKTGTTGKDFFLKNSSLSFKQNGDNTLTPTTVFGRSDIKSGSRLMESSRSVKDSTPSEYRLSRNEWVAEQIARWFQTNEAPISKVDKYFKWMADVYRRFAESLKSQGFYPNDTVNQIMNRFVLQAKGDVKADKMSAGTIDDALGELRLYHASPYSFDEFSIDAVNTGEGTQMEGWGLYFASMKDVAKWYHEMFAQGSRAKDRFRASTKIMDLDDTGDIPLLLQALPLEPAEKNALKTFLGFKMTYIGGRVDTSKLNSVHKELFNKGEQIFKSLGGKEEIIKGNTPQIYKVDVDIDENKMLLWDKPIEEQPKFVKDALKEHALEGASGRWIYRSIASKMDGAKSASQYLNQLGIPGIKYLDRDSRAAEEGKQTHNYVVFHDGAIQVREKFDNPESFMDSGEARRKPDPKVIEPDKKEAKRLYKAKFTPDLITHEKSLGSITGEHEGKFSATDSKGNIMGTLDYTRETIDGKPTTVIQDMKLNGKNARHRQDTAFSLLNQLHKDPSVNDNVDAVDHMKPYKQAFDALGGTPLTTAEQTTKKEAKEPKLGDIKRIPVFEKNTLPSMSPKAKNFFTKLPKALSLQSPIVSAVMTRNNSRVLEGKQAYKYPLPFGLTPDNIKTLTENRNSLAKFVSDTYFQGSDLQRVKSQTTSDIVGNAYDAYVEAKNQGKLKFESSLTQPVIDVFDKLDTNANDIKLGMNGVGVTKTSDIYYVPTTFAPTDIDSMVQDSVYEMERQDNMDNIEKQKTYDDIRKVKVGPGRISGPLTGVLSWINPITNAAKNSPFVGFIQDIAIARRDYGFRLQSKLMHMLEPVINTHGENTFNGLVGVLESNRLNNFKGYLDKDGYYVYKDDAGKLRRVADKQQSQSIMQMRGIFDSVLKERKRVDMAHRSTQDLLRKVGLGFNPTSQQIDNLIKTRDKFIAPGDKESLQNLSRYMKHIDGLMDSRDYVPFTRNGNTGITVKATDPETGKKETVAFVTFNKDNKGRLVKDAEWNNAHEVLQKYQGDGKYEISDAFELSKDAILGKISNKEMTLDLIDQLVDIMMHSKNMIGDNQANAVPTWEAIGKILRDDVAKKGFDSSLREAKNIDGYRKNWYNIIPNYIQRGAYSLSNRRYTPALRYALRQGENVTPEEKAYANRYVESLLSTDSDLFQNLRALQFNWVLGFRPASALLQLSSLVHMMPATLTLMTNSPLKAHLIQMRAFKEANFFAKLTRNSFYDISPEMISKAAKKYGWSEEKQKALYRAYQDGYLTQTLTFEEVGATPYDTSTWQGKMRKAGEEFTRIGGMMLRSTEELSRLTQFLGMYDALNEPNNRQRFHELVKKDDAQYRQHLALTDSTEPDLQYLMRYGMNNALALFGKEGRTPFQSTPAQFALPFATYPWQMFLNYYRMMNKMGPAGKKAALTATIGIISTAGIWGLPGFMLLKEGLEAALSLAFQEDIDLDKEIDNLGQEMFSNGDVNPWLSPNQVKQITGVMRRGLPSTYSGLDLNERLGFQTLGEQQIIGLKDALMTGKAPTGLATDMYGVVGGTVAMAPFQALNKYRDSGGSWIEAVNQLMPQFMKDIIQSNVIEPEKGKSFAGQTVLSADDASTWQNRLIGSSGFKSRGEGLREEQAKSVVNAENRLSTFKDAYARKVERFTKELVNADEEYEGQARENFNGAVNDYIEYLTSKNVPGNVIMSSVQRVIKDAQSEALGSRDYDLSNFFKMKQVAKEAREEVMKIQDFNKLGNE